jgi:exo-1,4-beta-D-glucosaminidase
VIKFIPPDSISTTNATWQYHCGTMTFGNTHIFDSALMQRYGPAKDVRDYLAKAQLQNYEAHRAMMEAYGLNKYNTATGVVQWMLSNPWPGLIWHTYDYYLYPAGTYFGMKKSMEPLHVMYSYKTGEVCVTNSLLDTFAGLTVKADVYDATGANQFSKTAKTSVGPDGIARCFTVPVSGDLYLLRLDLKDASGKTRSINWYWLSRQQDQLDWKKSKWYYTPQSGFADYTGLNRLSPATIDVNVTTGKKENETIHMITLKNTSKSVAFFLHIRALKGKQGDDILPLIFSDNYISLAPGESRTIECTYENADAGTAAPYVLVSGWNLDMHGSKASPSGSSGFGLF